MKDFLVKRLKDGSLSSTVLFFSSLVYATALLNSFTINQGDAKRLVIDYCVITLPYLLAVAAYVVSRMELFVRMKKK